MHWSHAFEGLDMANENNGSSVLKSIANALHVSVETFVLIVSVIFVVGASILFLKEMFISNPVKDIYMNWEDIVYVSDYFDEDKNTQIVRVTIESTRGLPYDIVVQHHELSQSKVCPIVINDSVVVPTKMGDTLVLPFHFDSAYGYVREYNKMLQEED